MARDLIERHDVMRAPIPVELIAEQEGIEVVRVMAGWNESGFLMRQAGSTPVIGIDPKEFPKRQRFTIAHELGHWRLHKGKPLIVDQSVMANKRDNISSEASDFEEIQANQFAAALLMPETLVRRIAESAHSDPARTLIHDCRPNSM